LGGPLQAERQTDDLLKFNFLDGVISYGDDCGFGSPIVATDVLSYISWIDSIMYGESKVL
jgi:secreted trypsin-like serine protease